MTDSDSPAPPRPAYDPQTLLNAQPVMVAVIDPATYIIQFQNDTGLSTLGDLAGQTCYRAIAGCATPCSFCKMPEALRTGTITMSEVPVSNERHLLVQWSKAVTHDGRAHVIETITDVTERKRIEDAAHRAEKMEALSRLAGGTAHDINNLLTVIASACDSADDRGLLPSASGEDPMRHIRQAVVRVGELMRRLTAFSHTQLVQPSVVDVNGALAAVEPRVRSLCGPQIEVTIAAKEEGLRIVADPRQIEHIVLVLAGNACDAMPAGGHLSLCTAAELVGSRAAGERKLKPGRFVRLEVRDTGCGIEPHLQEHLFEPYFQQAGRTGRGLGLASVYGMVRQCGGSIGVVSEPQVGTTFTLWFPCVEGEPPLSASAPPAAPPAQVTILLVEDDDDVRLAVGDMLERAGYQVQEACDGLDALRQVNGMAAAPHLTITDVMMPRMSGPQLVRQLHSVMPSVRVLYMSGYAGEALEPVGQQPVTFIQKPFGARELLRKVHEALS